MKFRDIMLSILVALVAAMYLKIFFPSAYDTIQKYMLLERTHLNLNTHK